MDIYDDFGQSAVYLQNPRFAIEHEYMSRNAIYVHLSLATCCEKLIMGHSVRVCFLCLSLVLICQFL